MRANYKDVKIGVACENRIVLSRSASELAGSHLEQRPGWPLLRRATSDPPRTLDGRSVSVVQWVMSLPDRSLYLNSQHPDTRESPPPKYHTETVDGSHKSTSSKASKLLKQIELLLRTKPSDCELFDYDALRDSTMHFSSGSPFHSIGFSFLSPVSIASKIHSSSLFSLSSRASDWKRRLELCI